MRFLYAIAAALILLLAALSRHDLHVCAQSSATSTSTSSKPTHSLTPETGCLTCLSSSVKTVLGCAAIKDFNPTTFSDLSSLNTDDLKGCFCALAASQAWLTFCTSPAQCSLIFASAIQTAYNVTRGAVCANVVAVQPVQPIKNGAKGAPGGSVWAAQALVSAVAAVVLTAIQI